MKNTSKHQSQLPKTVLLRTTLTRTIKLHYHNFTASDEILARYHCRLSSDAFFSSELRLPIVRCGFLSSDLPCQFNSSRRVLVSGHKISLQLLLESLKSLSSSPGFIESSFRFNKPLKMGSLTFLQNMIIIMKTQYFLE